MQRFKVKLGIDSKLLKQHLFLSEVQNYMKSYYIANSLILDSNHKNKPEHSRGTPLSLNASKMVNRNVFRCVKLVNCIRFLYNPFAMYKNNMYDCAHVIEKYKHKLTKNTHCSSIFLP